MIMFGVEIDEKVIAGVFAAIATLATPFLGFYMWKASRPHNEHIEESNTLAASITAIGEAAVAVVGASADVSEMMQGFLDPLRAEIERQKTRVESLQIKHDYEIRQMRDQFLKKEDEYETRLKVLSNHVLQLRQKMRENDIDPGPPPDLEGFTFD